MGEQTVQEKSETSAPSHDFTVSTKNNQSSVLKLRKTFLVTLVAFSCFFVCVTVIAVFAKLGTYDGNPTRFFVYRTINSAQESCDPPDFQEPNLDLKQKSLKKGSGSRIKNFFRNKKRRSMKNIQRYVPSLPSNFKEILNELDKRVSKLSGIKERAKNVHWPIDEGNLRRWLDLSKFNLEYHNIPLEEYVWNSVKWRESYGTCCIPNSDVYSALDKPLMYISGKDRLGRPLMVIQPGLQQSFDVDSSLRLLIYSVERAIKMMEAPTEQFTVIIDVKGMGFKNVPPASYLAQLFKVLMANYPLRLGIIFVLNASRPINLLWKVVSPICTERTRKKVNFLGQDEMAEKLLEYIAPDELEPQWGGESTNIYSRDSYLASHKPRKAR